ncbi:glycosyltransferase [Hydrogenophaga sp.]|uniref:glycosyltransferase n=1 Tax=Hydrogenophaga sp. TaxID=1904254 RepID=UPI003F6C4431
MKHYTIKEANTLFRENKLQEALEAYLTIREQQPFFKKIVETSIARCLKLLSNDDNSILEVPSTKSSTRDQTIQVRFFPDYTSTNPYQKLLYSGVSTNTNISPGSISDAINDLNSGAYTTTIFHLHWITHVLARATTEESAQTQCNEFLEKLEYFVSRGGELVWTIHNLIEHDSKYPNIELDLRQRICNLCKLIHIHSKTAIKEIEQHFKLPQSKIVVIPHGNYIDYYANFYTRETARRVLKIEDSEIVFLSLGQIRPYKGLETLLTAFSAAHAQNPNTRLIIAGKVVHPYKAENITAIAAAHSGVSIFPNEIPDEDLQIYFNAADATVLSYKSILTSGSVYLAMSFGNPVIGPDVAAIADLVTTGENGILYDSKNSTEALTTAIVNFCNSTEATRSAMQANAWETIQKYDWHKAANLLFCDQRNTQRSNQNRINYKKTFNIDSQTAKCEIDAPKSTESSCPLVAILILNYESTNDAAELIRSIKELNRSDLALVLVDNHSPSESIESLRHRFSDCIIIRTEENLGYAAGNNVGIRFIEEQSIPFIWILNPDTVLKADTLNELLRGSEVCPETDIWGSLITYYDRPDALWFGGGYITLGTRCTIGHMYQGKTIDSVPNKPYDVDYVTGASIFCKTNVFSRAGLIPEQYFLYFEETDWCVRASRAKLKIQINPKSVLLHKKRSQIGNMPTKYYMYYFVRGAVLFRKRFSYVDVVQSRKEVDDSFVQPWLARIQKASPKDYDFFKKLANKALDDGCHGVVGPQNLLTIAGNTDIPADRFNSIIKGAFSVESDNRIVGWVTNSAHPDERLKVSIFVDNVNIGFAQFSTNDVCRPYCPSEEAGGTGFVFTLPSELIDGGHHSIQAFAEGVALKSQLSAYKLNFQEPIFKGRIDGLQDRFLKGWCLDQANPQRTLHIAVYCENLLIATGFANISRPDLVSAGFKSERSGFNIPLPLKYCDGSEHHLTLKVVGCQDQIFSKKVQMDLRKFPLVPLNASLHSLYQWLFTRREISFVHTDNQSQRGLIEIEATKEILRDTYIKNPQDELVSIIMPIFNRQDIVEDAINSICRQSYTNWELVICDDGSSDDSLAVIRRIILEKEISKKVQIHILEKNKGVSAARNVALRHAKGTFISYLDSDNSWDSDFLLIMTNSLLNSGELACAYCGDRITQKYSVISPNGTTTETVAVRLGHLNTNLIENKNYIDLNVFMHTRELYQKNGGFREDMRRLVDWELIVRYIQNANTQFVPAILATYNLDASDNQITRTEDYNLNATKLKQSIEKVKLTKRVNLERQAALAPSLKNLTIILISNKDTSHHETELIYRSWMNTTQGTETTIIHINLIASTSDAQPNSIYNPIGKKNYTSSEATKYIMDLIKQNPQSEDSALVIASMQAIPSANWLATCRYIAHSSKTADSITSAHFIKGGIAHRAKDILFINSRADFDYDLTPHELNKSGGLLELSQINSEAVGTDRSSSFFNYLTAHGIKTIQSTKQTPDSHLHHDADTLISAILDIPELKVVYTPSLSMHEIA